MDTTQLPAKSQPPAPRSFVWTFLALTLFAVICLFVVRALVERFAAISWSEMRFQPLFVAAAIGCALATRVLSVVSYRLLCSCFSTPPRWAAMAVVTWLPPIGKYVPGKFASVAGAVWMLRRFGISAPVAASMVVLLNGLMVATGLVVAIPLTLWQPVYQALPMAWLWCAVLLAGGAACLHPRVFGAVVGRLLRLFKHEFYAGRLSLRGYAGPLVVMFVNWALNGASLWLIARAVTDVSIGWLPLCIAAGALAQTLGFLAFFAPVGLGVREIILLTILEPAVGASAALIAVAMRLLQILVDVVVAVVGFFMHRSLRRGTVPTG